MLGGVHGSIDKIVLLYNCTTINGSFQGNEELWRLFNGLKKQKALIMKYFVYFDT